jgi:hypothetical protein
MDDELSKKKMTQQVDNLKATSLPDAYGWDLAVDGLQLTIDMPSPKNDNEYTLVVTFDDFPQQPPSYLFDDDWPNCPDIKEDRGICIVGTREFYNEFGHGDRDFNHQEHTVKKTVQRIYHLMRK